MPKIKSDKKTVLVSARFIPDIKYSIDQAAAQEGISTSEWIRTIIIGALRERNLLSSAYRMPHIDQEQR